MTNPARLFSCVLVLCGYGLHAQGTGSYLNFESPQCRPIVVVRLGANDYLAACNTPDNCVEIYGPLVAGTTPAFITRVQTGAEPVSVVWNATRSRLYTANFLGDSVTSIELTGALQAKLIRTEPVGDEPMHIAFAPDNNSLFVTLGSRSSMTRRHWDTLAAFGPLPNPIDLTDTPTTPNKAIREPRTVLVQGTKLYVLGHRGGKVISGFGPGEAYDLDLWRQDLNTAEIVTKGLMGTNNFNMAFAANGDLYVVGTDALIDVEGEANLRVRPTGFVRTMLYRVQNPGGVTSPITSRDLNTSDGTQAVSASEALTQVTDVLAYPPTGTTTKLFVTAFGSDRVGVIAVGAGDINTWTISQRIAIPRATLGNPMAGPRAMALKQPNGIFGYRIYVLNRLDNSVAVIDPTTNALVDEFALQRDPTPQYIRTGRQFLYGAQFSGNGMVSCASCHVDGRTDGLSWDLSSGGSDQTVPALLQDSPFNDPACGTGVWPANKLRLITQTLQGMVNFELVNDLAQPYFTNEPLHWRADRATFGKFNRAFVGLMGMPNIGTPEEPKGITDEQMDQYRKSIFSNVYPPNPEQPVTRIYSGSIGNPNSFNPGDPEHSVDGSGALRGLKIFHTVDIEGCFNRSCVHCHSLPDGSNNRITEFSGGLVHNPLETAALRGIARRERRLEKGPSPLECLTTIGLFGNDHIGFSKSINEFITTAFASSPLTDIPDGFKDTIDYVRQFDTGVAPMVGTCLTVTSSNKSTQAVQDALAQLEGQVAAANVGLAAQGRIGANARGFWYDLTGPGAGVYRDDATGTGYSRSGLLGLVGASDVLAFQATPLGSDRRVAWQGTGAPLALVGGQPTSISLEPMVPNTANALVPLMTVNWAGSFAGAGDTCLRGRPPFFRTMLILQKGILNDAPSEQKGNLTVRHEAPRRFQVSGDNIRHGAKLNILMSNDPLHPPPDATSYTPFTLPLYPTDQFNTDNRRMWQTAVECDPLVLYMLVLGGPKAQGVGATLTGTYTNEDPPIGTFNPSLWNTYWVSVQNEDGTSSFVELKSIKLP